MTYINTRRDMSQRFPELNFSGIYMMQCIVNSKVYIGQAKNIYRRIREHRCRINDKNKSFSTSRFYLALRKYGIKQFNVFCLERVDDLSKLDEREQYYLDYTEVYQKDYGYNTQPIVKSNKGVKLTDEQKRKCAAPHIGRKHSAEEIQRRVDARKGYKHSPETLEKIRKSNTGNKRSDEVKKRNGDLKRGIKQSQETIDKRRQSRAGYKHSKETIAKISKSNKGKSRLSKDTLELFKKMHSKCVLQYSLDMVFIAEYYSTIEASRQTKISRGAIQRFLHGKGKNTTNFIWKYKTEPLCTQEK